MHDWIFGHRAENRKTSVNAPHPRETWTDKAAYDRQAAKLVQMFREKLQKIRSHVGADIKDAAPRLAAAAE